MKPRPLVEEIARDLPPGQALDVACGDGRNAVWLAERGWRVTAVDRAPAFAYPGMEVRTADLERHEFAIEEFTWDLIVMSYYLQADLFPPIVRGLKPGGVAIIIVHMFEPGHEASRFSLHPGELREAFQGNRILAYREGKPDPQGRAVAQIAIQA
jgi:SAM-dependent methyltransferase